MAMWFSVDERLTISWKMNSYDVMLRSIWT